LGKYTANLPYFTADFCSFKADLLNFMAYSGNTDKNLLKSG